MAVSLALVLLTTMTWLLAVHTYRSIMLQSFRERSVAYVQAFASSAIPWLDPIQPAMLQSAARFMLVGSAQYVQIASGGQLIVDERTEGALDLGSLTIQLNVSPGIQEDLTNHSSVLDIFVPLTNVESSDTGYVRIGIDTAGVILQLRMIALWAGALAFGVDTLLLGLLWWLMGFRMAVSNTNAAIGSKGGASEKVVSVGDLRIDTIGKLVFFKNQSVQLTPKQYALIEFLAREPDRVFTDREIVDNVWEASSYADSKDVKQYVYLVRRRLSTVHPTGKRLIETVSGFGYKLVSEPVDEELTDV